MKTINKTFVKPEVAKAAIEAGKKVTVRGRLVKWVNLNNNTCYADDGVSGRTYDNEEILFVIHETKEQMEDRMYRGLQTEDTLQGQFEEVLEQIKRSAVLKDKNFTLREMKSDTDIQFKTTGSIDEVEIAEIQEIIKGTPFSFFIHCTAKNGEVELLIY